MQHFAVSRTTVSRALRDLELQGLIRRRRGSGTYVRELAPATEHLDLAFFVPWVESGEGLPYVEGLIHQRLADLASRRNSTLLLKCLADEESVEGQRTNRCKVFDRFTSRWRFLLSRRATRRPNAIESHRGRHVGCGWNSRCADRSRHCSISGSK